MHGLIVATNQMATANHVLRISSAIGYSKQPCQGSHHLACVRLLTLHVQAKQRTEFDIVGCSIGQSIYDIPTLFSLNLITKLGEFNEGVLTFSSMG